jgi:Mycothiol maleylpyruvate isomerase N-terminal domain
LSTPLEQVNSSWQSLQQAIEGISDERMAEPGVAGEWSVKDLLAHVAYWDDPDLPDSGGDWQPINERVASERANWSLAEVRNNLTETHERMLTALRAKPDIDPGQVIGDWEHYDEHAAEIRAWREKQEL